MDASAKMQVLQVLASHAFVAEVGNTVSADHLLQMATMPLEHKTTALGVPYHCSVSYLFDGADVLMQSLHSLFGLLVTGNTPRYCPQASQFGMKLCVAARRFRCVGDAYGAVAPPCSLPFSRFLFTPFPLRPSSNPAGLLDGCGDPMVQCSVLCLLAGDLTLSRVFLHGSRRLVCRGCTGHLMLVKRELRSRLQKSKKQTKQKQPNPKQHKHKAPQKTTATKGVAQEAV